MSHGEPVGASDEHLERDVRKRAHIRQFPSPTVGLLSREEVGRLTMPIHAALTLLPLGLYEESHAHDLAAFLTVAQVVARNANRRDIMKAGDDGASALLAMRDRARQGKSWNVTAEERDALMRSVTAIDEWFSSVKKVAWIAAVRTVYRMCDEASERGLQELDLIVEAA